jgi:hypothetical protein
MDEPLDALLTAADACQTPRFTSPAVARAPVSSDGKFRPSSITGFLSQSSYNALLAASDVVVCLTTHDNIMQNGACEALFVETPIVTSDWPILRDYFGPRRSTSTTHPGTYYGDCVG